MARSPRMPDDGPDAWPEAPPRRPAPRRADPEPAETFVSWRSLVIGALVAVAVAVGGVLFARSLSRDEAAVASADGEVPLIRAPEEPWRSRPGDAGGVSIEGADRTLYDAGQGVDPIGEIALGEVPVEPEARDAPAPPPRDLLAQTDNPEAGDVAVLDESAAPPAGAPSAAAPAVPSPPPRTAAEPSPATPSLPARTAAPPATATATRAPAAGSGPLLQLGAFSSRDSARDAWGVFSGRFTYLAGLEPVFERVERDGQTLWRLKASGAGSPARARDLCARLRVAGEDCIVVGG